MLVYKLTDEHGRTRDDTQWGPGVAHETDGRDELCGPGWLHYYEHPLLAVLHNPSHANVKAPRLWASKAEGEIKRDGWVKAGCTRLTTIREIPLPAITAAQRARYAIYCAKAVCDEPAWNKWADGWLSGADRSVAAADAARAMAYAAARAARAAAFAAADAAAYAACAARAVAYAAARAARAAASASDAAAWADRDLNLAAIAERAVAEEPA